MRLSTEPDTFCGRLHQGLAGIGFPADDPGAFAREFNRRHQGAAITADATRKWLLGEAIPTQARLQSIARWLNVSPHWLIYGGPSPVRRQQAGASAPLLPHMPDLGVLADLHLLDDAHRRLARQFVATLLAMQVERAASQHRVI